MLRGDMPYKNAWDIYTPGIYYIHALALTLFGKSGESIRIMDLLIQGLTAFALAGLESMIVAIYNKK